MAKVEYGEYTAWTVNGTPRYMKNGKLIGAKNIDPEMKLRLDELLEKTPSEPAKPTLNPGLGEEPLTTEVAAPSVHEPDDVAELRKQVEELKRMMQSNPQQFAPQPQFNNQGGVTGTRVLFSSDEKDYPDPRERLANEPKLKRFAFKENYELEWSVSEVPYETKQGIWQSEPRFKLELHRIVIDEDTGEPTNNRYVVCRLLLHEDPAAARAIAREQGIDMNSIDPTQFLNEMRYLRMRDWLVESFMPPKPVQPHQQFRDEVIGGKLVQMFTKNSEEASGIPFSQFNTNQKL